MNKEPPPKPKRAPDVYINAMPSRTFQYEALPTAPPRLCLPLEENIFQFPPLIQGPLRLPQDDGENISTQASADRDRSEHCCLFCQPYREDRQTIEPLKERLSSTIEAMDKLYETYAFLDKYMEQKLATIQNTLDEEKEPRSPTLPQTSQQHEASVSAPTPSAELRAQELAQDAEFELEHSLTFLESIFGTEIVPPCKPGGAFKRMRERSKSMMEDELRILNRDRSGKSGSSRPYLLRRQSTYSDNKSKVSKWTKVKAAFKWERANVPSPAATETTGLSPVNHEVARYLKVPAIPCGGSSSADSIISSSSGQFMSDTGGTPGTISSASSLDDVDPSCRAHSMRKDSTKSDIRLSGTNSSELRKSVTDDLVEYLKQAPPTKSTSNKSIRRSKAFSDFEVLPEDQVADIKATTGRRNKLPPSPLNLDQDLLNDTPNLYSPHMLKSPKDGTQSLNRMRRISSPGNSSVPSSPSRHSDFFGEFESEELSSGDFSEPTTPNRKTFQQKKDECIQRYQALQSKLDQEFKAKQREFERKNSGRALRGSIKSDSHSPTQPSPIKVDSHARYKSNEHSPTQVYNNYLLPTDLMEEKLTPEFKRKLHTWRNKMVGTHPQTPVEPLPSPTGRQSSTDSKSKIDWNLWSTGQVKLAGQGLSVLPHQKDLPEKFQKKLEQWNRLKSGGGGGAISDNDSLKPSTKHNHSTRRGSDDDRWYKHKPHDKEKLAKLKAIVTPDHQSKNIEVKTSAGVMKFEGISRKFTRKLYEWEKARGIGPEASTFALLPPGYCQIDVRRPHKDRRNVATENSPTLSRSLSLDSLAPNSALPVISKQASSLSLDNVHELEEFDGSLDALTDCEYKKNHEPEALMVEVEEQIDDTASPLVTAHTLVEQQTPIYKYEEVQCNDYCNSRRVQSFESHTNVAPLLSALKRTENLFLLLKKSSPDIMEDPALRSCQSVLLNIRSIYPYYSNNLMKPNVLNAISDVQNELGRLTELCHKAPLDEACCQETMEERHHEYNEEFHGLCESLECLKQCILSGTKRPSRDIVPDINITSEDGHESSVYGTVVSTGHDEDQLSATEHELSAASQLDNETETTNTTATYRAPNTVSGNNGVGKKKLRLRKMGSRQNSKTESDSSDGEVQSALGTPRRLRRKNFRLKQRSLDDDYRTRSEEVAYASAPNENDDVLYTLKVKPGQPIEQSQVIGGVQQVSKVIGFVPPPLPELHTLNYNTNANVFVKTKRKLFTTIAEPNAAEGIAVIEKVLDESPMSAEEKKICIPKTVEDVGISVCGELKCQSALAWPNLKSNSHKCISLKDLSVYEQIEDTRKCRSMEELAQSSKSRMLDVRPPLASDSFCVINKGLTKPGLGKGSTYPQAERKPQLYKKNSVHKSQTKIVNKIAKSNSGSDYAPSALPNKLDNTLPRIQRKLDGKTLTPTIPKQFVFPPTEVEMVRPVTPLSERAIRIQRAKAEFLQASPMRSATTTAIPEATHQAVICNVSEDSGALQPLKVQKSVSVSTMTLETRSVPVSPQQSDVGTDQESIAGTYDSSQRSVTRSGKISSKLGFATLASKLRLVKAGGKKNNDNQGSSSALSALCRQTLLADVITLPQRRPTNGSNSHEPRPALGSGGSTPQYQSSVYKSRSSPHASSGSDALRGSFDGLNKSLSEQYVKQLKESDV